MASAPFVQSVLTFGTTLKCVKSQTSVESQSSNEDHKARKKRRKVRKERSFAEPNTSTNAAAESSANGKVRVIKTGSGRSEPVKKFKQTTLYGEIAIASDDDGAFNSDELTDCDDDGISFDSNDDDDDFDFEMIPRKDRKTAPTRHEIMARRRVIWFRQKKYLEDSSASSSQESAVVMNADCSIEIIVPETTDSSSAHGSQTSLSGEQTSQSSIEIHAASSNDSIGLNKRRKFRRNHSIKKYLVVKTDGSADSTEGLVQESQLLVRSANKSVRHLSDSEEETVKSSGTRCQVGPIKQSCVVLDSSTDNIEEANEDE